MGNTASDKKNARCYSLKFSRNTDKLLIAKLDSVDSVQAYIKSLIIADIEKEGKPMYHVKEEYLSLWGEDTTEDTVVTQDELERLADEWGKPVDELLEQLTEI